MHPPPAPHWITLAVTVVVLVFFRQFVHFTAAHTCSSRAMTGKDSCPPFKSQLSFPFSSSPDCGHPSFQIRCSSPNSFISINNFSFEVLRHEPNSSSLLLSPQLSFSAQTHPNCSSASLPTRSIDLSGSPFRFSDRPCSRLSVLQSCSHLSPPNCSLCSWECELLDRPVRLLHGCGSMHQPVSEDGCHRDILGYLQIFLKYGIEVQWDEGHDTYFSGCKECQARNGICGFNSSDPSKKFLCFHSQTHFSPPWIRRGGNSNRIVILCTIFIFTCVLLVVALATVIFRSRGMKSSATEEDPTTLFLHRHRLANLLPPVFSYEELESSTNGFDPKRKIGDGGFGSVYIGQLYDRRIVAVKMLHRNHAAAASTKSFCNEIIILSSIEHPNLVKLHGYCSDPRGLLLVYDYVSNGTLADHLHGSKSSYRKGSLTWQVRVDIALQTAMAVEYLHFAVEPAIVHRDITSSNIFIEKDMRIKIGDFGLSRLLVFPESSSSSSSGSVWTGPQGTPGYLDPDYHRSFRLTEKSDVYSFGVILLELISGMKAVDLSRDKREMALADLVVSKIQVGLLHQVVDPVLILEGEAMCTVDAAAELAFRCVAADKDDRPDAREVVAELKRIRNRTRGHRASNVVGDAVKT
ncbi:hypothetical protein HHK36_024820 [Tetracentron sinense]|uniref:Protein kinase domain-containing protein n=1 Tax=Tetracentron sinense TaxID=13715 RepID=A0A834YLT0_TETSI|nr:hypothetical protein HHK36_024820 [Tetracentron sinense]